LSNSNPYNISIKTQFKIIQKDINFKMSYRFTGNSMFVVSYGILIHLHHLYAF